MNSVEIAKEYNKAHKDILRMIRNLIKRNPEIKSSFTKSSYIASNGKKNIMYDISTNGEKILRNKFKYNIRSARFEYKMLNEICDFLDGLHIKYIKQYPVLSYRIDLFLPDYNLSVEYDEKEHKYKQEYDRNRENNITDNIGCKFVRIKEDETIGSAIARILEIIGGEIFNEKRAVWYIHGKF